MSCKIHIHFAKVASLVVLGALFMIPAFGCANKEAVKTDLFLGKWRGMADKSKASSPSHKARAITLPEEKEEITTGKVPKGIPERRLPTEKVSLKMHETDVAVLLRALARIADQNVMINEGVKGKISINAKDAPWDQVFRGILRTQGLTYRWEGEIIRVMSVEDMEHDLRMDAIQEKRKLQEMGLKRVEPLMTKIIGVDYADANKLKENLQQFLTKDKEGKPRGSVKVDEHTNSLIIQAIREDIARMIPLIQGLDRPTPQILIEANIVETTRETARQLGIQWGGLYHNGDYWISPGANTGEVMGKTLTPGIDPTSGIAANFPAEFSKDAGLTLGIVTEDIGNYLLNVQLSALQDEGKLNILSSPSITTVDNQKATIESGAEIPFQTVTGVGSNQTVELEWKTATLKLEVTPHVIEEKMLKLNINTTKDEVDFTNTVQGNPTILTKKAETNVILLDGQTTVIGGLNKEKTVRTNTGIPWLKDIPFLGYLFKSEGRDNKMEEVLIFITPHILKELNADVEQAKGKHTQGQPSSSRD